MPNTSGAKGVDNKRTATLARRSAAASCVIGFPATPISTTSLRQLRVSKMTIYSHFGSKQTLFLAGDRRRDRGAVQRRRRPSMRRSPSPTPLETVPPAFAEDLIRHGAPSLTSWDSGGCSSPNSPGTRNSPRTWRRSTVVAAVGSLTGFFEALLRAKPALRRRAPGARHAVPVDAHRRPARCRAARPTRYASDVACPRVTCGPNRVGCLRQSPALSGFRSDPCSKRAGSLDAECCPYSHSMSAHTCRINTSPHG